MTQRKDGGPAFGHGDHVNGGSEGMSLRDYFAGQALAGGIASAWTGPNGATTAAETAYEIADAMLKERAEGVAVNL